MATIVMGSPVAAASPSANMLREPAAAARIYLNATLRIKACSRHLRKTASSAAPQCWKDQLFARSTQVFAQTASTRMIAGCQVVTRLLKRSNTPCCAIVLRASRRVCRSSLALATASRK